MRLAALALLVALPAWANDADKRAKVPGTDLLAVAHNDFVELRRGKTSIDVPLHTSYPDLALLLEVKTRGDEVTLSVAMNCGGDHTVKLTRAAIEARFLAVPGADEPTLARALALDPSNADLALRLAAAEAAAGKLDAARARLLALAPARRDRVVPLVARTPALAQDAALAAFLPPRGSARSKKLGAAYAPALHLVAYADNMANSMSDEDRTPGTLYLLDARDGRTLDRVPMRKAADTDELLAVLGFEPVPLAEIATDEDGKTRRFFPEAKLGVVIDGKSNVARVLRGNQVLGEASAEGGRHFTAGLTPEGVIVGSRVDIGDGCGGWDYDSASFIPIATPAPAAPRDPR